MLANAICQLEGCYILHVLFYFLPREAQQSAVLPRQIVHPSVCNVKVSWSYRLQFLEMISQLSSLTFPLSADPNITDLLQREHP